MQRFREPKDQVIEQVGSLDPMPNERDEKLVALNLERIQYWLGEGVHVSDPAASILGREKCSSFQKMLKNPQLFLIHTNHEYILISILFRPFWTPPNTTTCVHEGMAKTQS